MTLKGRLQKVEEALDANKKFLLWLDHAKAVGGFVSYWERELKGPLVPFKWFGDEEAYFLWRLVNDVNIAILNDAQTNHDLRRVLHCALDGVLRQITQPDESGRLVPVLPAPEVTKLVGEFLYGQFKTIFEEALSLAGAIDELSQTYLGGEDLLFVDTRRELVEQISQLRTTAQLLPPLAAWLNLEPLMMEGFVSGHPKVDTKATQMADFSRATALVQSGYGRQFKDALQQLSPELAVSS